MSGTRKKMAAAWFYQNLYRDEQIRPRADAGTEPVPEEIRAMHALAASQDCAGLPREAIFVRQGRLMADYEDDCVYLRDVVRYFPTYESLTDRELRGYFSWRSAWRKGEREKTSLSYAFLYLYELLNGIGVSDPVDGFDRLRAFGREYGELDDKICSYLNRWLWDYVVFYRLDPVLLEDRPELRFYRMAERFFDMEGQSDEALFEAALALSSYRMDSSRLCRKQPETLRAVTVRVLRRMAAYYGAHRKQSFAEDCFGALAWEPVILFESAVFYDGRRWRDCEVELSPLCRYVRTRGAWSVCRLNRPCGRSKRLGDVLRTVDAMLREALGVGYEIRPGLSTRWIVALIKEEIDAHLRERKAAETRRVTIDYSRLPAIREDAGLTREKLLADEEREEEPPIPAVPEREAPPAADDDGLNEDERRYLRSLLTGTPTDWLRERGLMAAVLIDGINEKLFDRFGDTVLAPDGEPIEDYREELKEMIRG